MFQDNSLQECLGIMNFLKSLEKIIFKYFVQLRFFRILEQTGDSTNHTKVYLR
jgi:hypothetical protein